MMLAELNKLYKRLIDAGEPLATKGRSLQKISFCIVINEKGELVGIDSVLQEKLTPKKDKKGVVSYSSTMISGRCMMLGSAKPSGAGINPCFLWDNAAYLLGYVDPTSPEKDKARAKRAFEESRRKHLSVESQVNHPDFSAVCRFLESWSPDEADATLGDKIDLLGSNGVFRIQSSIHDFIHQLPQIQTLWDSTLAESWAGPKKAQAEHGTCLVTGQKGPLAILHDPAIKGVIGAQSSGAKLVSYNCSSFTSYAKEQGTNAPVSEEAAFGYCNVLNYLLNRKLSRQRLGDTTMVFWTDAPQALESSYLSGFAALAIDPEDDGSIQELDAVDENLTRRVKDSLEKLASGLPVQSLVSDSETRFFILGLAPNASRLSIRFYEESRLTDFLENVQRHYLDMQLQPRSAKFNDPKMISPFMILRQTVRDVKEMPSMYGSALLRSILLGRPYPDVIAQAIIRRIKTDFNINYKRVAFLKAWLIRRPSGNTNNNTISIMLDKTNTNTGYVLGRLFATLLKTQEDALPNLNRTIRESCFSGASSSPRSVFPRIMKTYAHHLKKIENRGRVITREKLMAEICAMIDNFPPHLNLEQQGMFSIGFYHQMQDFYIPKEDKMEKPQI